MQNDVPQGGATPEKPSTGNAFTQGFGARVDLSSHDRAARLTRAKSAKAKPVPQRTSIAKPVSRQELQDKRWGAMKAAI
jgi:hypothetical protein